MLIEKITSRQNPLLKRFRKVRVGSERHLVFLEGVRLIEDALNAGVHFETVAFTSALESTERGAALFEALQHVPCRGAHVSKQIMEAITETESPQGVAAIVTRSHFDLPDAFSDPPQLIVIADQLQDPGNLGTIVRTAKAAGATGVITTRYTVDPFNHKALRASMGAAFRLPVVTDAKPERIVALCREHKIKIVASRPPSPRPIAEIEDAALAELVHEYTHADLTAPVALIVGRESSGIPQETAMQADASIYIPMAEGVESLNVAAAATVLLYEAARQRDFKFHAKKKV